MHNELLDQLANEESSKFAAEYFKENSYEVLDVIDRRDIVQIGARCLKTNKNETFHLSLGNLSLLVFDPSSKYHPWKYKKVARGIDTRSYLDEMRAAINENRQK